MTYARLAGTALILTTAAAPALAQVAVLDSANSSANPNGLVISPVDDTLVQASFNTDEQVASLTSTLRVSAPFDWKGAGLLTVTAQTPLAQGQTFVNTATLDGLTKSTAVSFTLSYFTGGLDVDTNTLMNVPANNSACWDLVEKAGRKPLPAGQRDKTCAGADVDDAVKTLTSDIEKATVAQKDATAERKILDEVSKGQGALKKAITPRPADTWQISLNGKVGYDEHDYFDAVTLQKATADRTPWQIGGSLGYIWPSGTTSLHLSANYQEAFLDGGDGETQTKCLPDLTCASGFIGAPVLKDKALISADFRWMVGRIEGVKIPFGIAPKITYDAIADSEAVQFPVYFVSDSDGKLSGGIRYDWTSTTHVSTVGIFVSTAFSLF